MRTSLSTITPASGSAPATDAQLVSGFVGQTGLPEITAEVPPMSVAPLRELVESSGRREHTPIRKAFALAPDDSVPPLAQLVSTKGRGGSVVVKLYLALVWRCSKPPFDTNISARHWAALLGLDDPNAGGSRRVHAALRRLEDLRLVRLDRRRGEAPLITILRESGSGDAYTLPSTSYVTSAGDEKEKHLYFKVPKGLWTSGHLQAMSASALAMLLVVLAESNDTPGKKVWWSTEVFPARYKISPAMRARGTRELVQRRLLLVTKQLVSSNPKRAFSRERVRNLYELINEARPS